MKTSAVRAIALATSVAVLTGCALAYEQRGGPAIADAIREASPANVVKVSYQAGDFMDGATVNVTMDGTVAEAESFLCEVVTYIVRNGDPPESLGVWIWSRDDDVLAVDWDTPCP